MFSCTNLKRKSCVGIFCIYFIYTTKTYVCAESIQSHTYTNKSPLPYTTDRTNEAPVQAVFENAPVIHNTEPRLEIVGIFFNSAFSPP